MLLVIFLKFNLGIFLKSFLFSNEMNVKINIDCFFYLEVVIRYIIYEEVFWGF